MNDQVNRANVVPTGTIGNAPAGNPAPIDVMPDLKCTLPPDNTFVYILLIYCAVILFGMTIVSFIKSRSQKTQDNQMYSR